MRRIVLWCLAGLVIAMPFAASAVAAPGCSGLMNGTSLQPVPKPLSLALPAQTSDTANPSVAQAFVAGMAAAGVNVVAPNAGDASIALTFSVGRPGSGVNTYNNLAWVSGEPLPNANEWSLQGATLQASAEVTNAVNYGLVWTGTFQCVIDGSSNPTELATTIGRVIGGAIGKNFERTRF